MERCGTVYARVMQRARELKVARGPVAPPENVVSSGMTTSRQFGTCRRRDGSPGDQKRQAGQRDGGFFKNTTRTIERSDVSVSFVSSTAARVVLGQKTRPQGRSSFPSIGSQGWLALAACEHATPIAVQTIGVESLSQPSFGALHFFAVTRLLQAKSRGGSL